MRSCSVLEALQSGVWEQDDSHCMTKSAMLSMMCTRTHWEVANADLSRLGRLWVPTCGTFRVYDGVAACDVLRRLGGLVVVGESIERHVYMGLLLVLSDDYDTGGLADLDNSGYCSGERQFVLAQCRSPRDLDRRPIKHCGPVNGHTLSCATEMTTLQIGFLSRYGREH